MQLNEDYIDCNFCCRSKFGCVIPYLMELGCEKGRNSSQDNQKQHQSTLDRTTNALTFDQLLITSALQTLPSMYNHTKAYNGYIDHQFQDTFRTQQNALERHSTNKRPLTAKPSRSTLPSTHTTARTQRRQQGPSEPTSALQPITTSHKQVIPLARAPPRRLAEQRHGQARHQRRKS